MRRFTPRMERKLNLPVVKVIEHVNDRLADAVDYRNYGVTKNLSRYDDYLTRDC